QCLDNIQQKVRKPKWSSGLTLERWRLLESPTRWERGGPVAFKSKVRKPKQQDDGGGDTIEVESINQESKCCAPQGVRDSGSSQGTFYAELNYVLALRPPREHIFDPEWKIGFISKLVCYRVFKFNYFDNNPTGNQSKCMYPLKQRRELEPPYLEKWTWAYRKRSSPSLPSLDALSFSLLSCTGFVKHTTESYKVEGNVPVYKRCSM
ncbi:hypothetical protein C0J52_26663, partial [Blattella germanica]